MIPALSAATTGLRLAAARFDGAASQVSASAADESSPEAAVAGAMGLSDAMVGMVVARFAFMASLQTARVTNEMLGDMLQSFA